MFRKEIDRLKDLAVSLDFEQVKYKKLFEYAPKAIVLICNNKYVDCNKAALKLFGYNTKDEFLCDKPNSFYCVNNLRKLLFLKVKEIINSDIDDYPQKFILKYFNLNGEQSINVTLNKIDIYDEQCFVVALSIVDDEC